MTDMIIKELWEIKDSIAHENGYDVETLITYLQKKHNTTNVRMVNLTDKKKSIEQTPAADSKVKF